MTYVSRLPPRKHQLTALHRILNKPTHPADTDTFALLMEMGTGKSKVIVDEWGTRADAGDVSDLLVMAPAGCFLNWFYDRGDDEPSEVRKNLDPALFEKTVMAPWRSGGGRTAREAVQRLIRTRNRPCIMVVNSEALSAVEDAKTACREFIETSRRGVVFAIDESTDIKNEDSLRTEAATELGHMPNIAARRILSGLVAPNSPLDLYSQFEFLDWRILGFRSFWAFKCRYAVMRSMKVGGWDPETKTKKRGRTIRQIVNYQNVEELNGLIAPYSYRVLKEECLDLPPKQYLPIRDVELTPDQKRIYTEIRDFATSKVAEVAGQGRYVVATMVLAQRLRMDQVLCGFVKDEEGVEHDIRELRTKLLMQTVEETMGKIIIWTSHDRCIRKISEALRKEYGPRSVAQFWGGNANTRHIDEKRFKSDAGCRFMVSTPMAGGMGNTWVVAGTQIFYNNSDSLRHRMQAEDRNHRDGLTGPRGAGRADYVDLCAAGTIDYKKIKSLRKKLDIASLINGDNYREWLI